MGVSPRADLPASNSLRRLMPKSLLLVSPSPLDLTKASAPRGNSVALRVRVARPVRAPCPRGTPSVRPPLLMLSAGSAGIPSAGKPSHGFPRARDDVAGPRRDGRVGGEATRLGNPMGAWARPRPKVTRLPRPTAGAGRSVPCGPVMTGGGAIRAAHLRTVRRWATLHCLAHGPRTHVRASKTCAPCDEYESMSVPACGGVRAG